MYEQFGGQVLVASQYSSRGPLNAPVGIAIAHREIDGVCNVNEMRNPSAMKTP